MTRRKNDIHDADLLVVDAGEPLCPEIGPEFEIGDETENGDPADHDRAECRDENWLVVGDGLDRQPAEDQLQKVRIGKHGLTRSLMSFRRKAPG
jgi:hypothetical protein